MGGDNPPIGLVPSVSRDACLCLGSGVFRNRIRIGFDDAGRCMHKDRRPVRVQHAQVHGLALNFGLGKLIHRNVKVSRLSGDGISNG